MTIVNDLKAFAEHNDVTLCPWQIDVLAQAIAAAAAADDPADRRARLDAARRRQARADKAHAANLLTVIDRAGIVASMTEPDLTSRTTDAVDVAVLDTLIDAAGALNDAATDPDADGRLYTTVAGLTAAMYDDADNTDTSARSAGADHPAAVAYAAALTDAADIYAADGVKYGAAIVAVKLTAARDRLKKARAARPGYDHSPSENAVAAYERALSYLHRLAGYADVAGAGNDDSDDSDVEDDDLSDQR